MLSAATVLSIFNWCAVFICILVFLSIFLIIYKCRQELRDASLLLTCNSCFATLLTCITMWIMTSSNLFTGFLLYNMKFCVAWGVFYDIFECAIYFSYCLQAFYRLCRIVFYTKKFLTSFSLNFILIICQWLLIFAFLIPPGFINWYARLPTENFCLIPYTSVIPEIYHILVLYLIPLICIGTIYIWITRFMRQTSQASTLVIAVIQRQRNQRDLTVIKRIIMLIGVLIVLRFPTIIFMIYAIIVGYTYSLTYGIVGVTTSTCLIFIGFSTIYTTPQLRKRIHDYFVHGNNRVQSERIAMNQVGAPISVIDIVNTPHKTKQEVSTTAKHIP
ncbi:unnamed protein product [Rotaria sordida]|uniref:G-protein coupled receptors family 1 profile domain-containing protein n=1 Tax=Rotaria sordida TaxID=392033 RepID=A0A814EDU4_9BILA|nr:unnamed protein product [Rotaria sordida]CAF3835555.1 unnamed protein product [Rotaria sordida]